MFRLLCNEPRYCSASYMFVTRGLFTCKMLIRIFLNCFMMCIAKSGNTILQSILNSDALYTSQMYQHWRSVLNIYHFWFKRLLLLWKVCYHWMNVLRIVFLSQTCITTYINVIFWNDDIELNFFWINRCCCCCFWCYWWCCCCHVRCRSCSYLCIVIWNKFT